MYILGLDASTKTIFSQNIRYLLIWKMFIFMG